MKLQELKKECIKESIHYNGGTIIIIDENYIPIDCIDSSKKALIFFDKNEKLSWISSGVDEAGFWQDYGDSFTGIFLYENEPVVTTFSCHVYDINMSNGKLTYRDMSK